MFGVRLPPARARAPRCRLPGLNSARPGEAPEPASPPPSQSLGTSGLWRRPWGRRGGGGGGPRRGVPTLWPGESDRTAGTDWRPSRLRQAAGLQTPAAPAPAPPFPQTPRQMKRVLGALAFWERAQEPTLGLIFLPRASPTRVFVTSVESVESRSHAPSTRSNTKGPKLGRDFLWGGPSGGGWVDGAA